MENTLITEIIIVLLLGSLAQWLAWRMRMPSILLLLVAGFVAGPIMGWVHPDKHMGDSLLPLVALAVAVILFEGGLSLRIDELRKVGIIIRNLLTIGVGTTWLLASATAHFVGGLNEGLSIILGALLTVTGPTVILPMLRHIRPQARVASIVRWEGIANDPIGALLAVLVFEFVVDPQALSPGAFIAGGMAKTVLAGGGIGLAAGFLLGAALRRHWIPDFLANPTALTLAVAVYAMSDHIQPESGLFAVTLAGITLAYRSPSEARHILEFKENLRVLLISLLFIVLAARFTPADFRSLMEWRTILFVITLIAVVRPMSVFLSTLGTNLSWAERVFLSWMAPRGIVAAAVSSVFALQLEAAGHGDAKMLMLLTFATIIGTVLFYGLTAGPVAHRLGIAERNPQGILFVGAHPWARQIAKALQDLGVRVFLLDTNRLNIMSAKMMKLPAYEGSAMAENILDKIDILGIGRLLAMTSNDELNAIACLQFQRTFGRPNVYQLPPAEAARNRATHERHLHGTWLFHNGATFAALDERFRKGAIVKATKITAEFNDQAYRNRYGETLITLFIVTPSKAIRVVGADRQSPLKEGETVVAIVPSEAKAESPPAPAKAPESTPISV